MQIMEIFRNFQKEDLKELSLFLQSEFNNRTHLRHDVLRLFEILKKNYPVFDPQKIEKERVARQLYPGTEPIKGKFDKVASELNKLIREYLLWKHYQSPKGAFDKSLDWLNILRDFSLNSRYEQYYARAERDFFESQPVSPRYYFDRFIFDYEKYFWLSTMNTAKTDMNMYAVLKSLSVFFETFRLELLNNLLTQQSVMKMEIPDDIQNHFHNALSPVPASTNVILEISSNIFNLLHKKNYGIEDFSAVMALLQKYEHQIEQTSLVEYYRHLRNFCTFLINTGDEYGHLIPFLHELQKDNLERGYMYVDDKLLATTYLSIPRMAIMAGNVQWAAAFVENYRNKVIRTADADEFYPTCKALCLFAQKEYSAALQILPATSENAIYYLLARRLELMCYYELRAENILNKLEAFKMLIRRASEKFLSTALKDANNTFANLLTQIVLTPPGDKKRAILIENRIRKKKPVAESMWLLSIVNKWK